MNPMNDGESRYEPRNPRQTEHLEHYPGPMSAIGITVGAFFATVMVASMFGTRPDFGAIGVGQVVGFGFIAILATQRIVEPRDERLGLRGFEPEFFWVLVLLLPSIFLMSELDNLIRDFAPPAPIDPDAADTTTPALEASYYTEIQRFIVFVGLAPVMEEWLFRGVIQQGLVGHMGRIRGVFFAALLFALLRIVPGGPSTLVSLILVSLLMGMLYGAVRIATGSLLAAIMLHMGFNAIQWLADVYREDFPIDGFNVPNSHTDYNIILASIIATFFGLRALKEKLDNATDDPPLDPREWEAEEEGPEA